MIRYTDHKNKKPMVGLQKSSRVYTFLHWLDHPSVNSRYRWTPCYKTLSEFCPIGPTMLVEWLDD